VPVHGQCEAAARSRLRLIGCRRGNGVPHARPLGLEVAGRKRIGRHQHGNAPRHLDAESAQRLFLGGVVRQKVDRTHPEVVKHRRGRVVTASVVGEAEQAVGIDGIGTVRLKRISPHLVGQSDAPAFLPQVQDRAEAAPCDLGLRCFELVFAIALEGAENFAGETLGMDPNRHVRATCQRPHDQGHVFVGEAAQCLFRAITKYLHFECTVARGQWSLRQYLELRPDLLYGDVHLALLTILYVCRVGKRPGPLPVSIAILRSSSRPPCRSARLGIRASRGRE
jgi:hypothetical protein